MIFSKSLFGKLIVFGVLLLTVHSFAQKNQRIAYIDIEYILENVPEYQKAQQSLTSKITKWRSELDKMSREIEKLKTDLATEREILTASLILEKEDKIELKQKELRQKEEEYFGSNGSLFLFRKRIIYPVQDIVYNAVQDIAKRQKYDFVLDKSSDLIMLYSNKKYDISELVLRSIVIDRKRSSKSNNKAKASQKKSLSDAQRKRLQARLDAQKKKQELRLKEKKRIDSIRAKRKADIEAKRALLRKKKEEANKKKEESKKEEQENN